MGFLVLAGVTALTLVIALVSTGAVLTLLLYCMRRPVPVYSTRTRARLDTRRTEHSRMLARRAHVAVLLLAAGAVPALYATALDPADQAPDPADQSIERFLAQKEHQPAYRAVRHLQAENGSRKGWVEAVTEYSRAGGFRYQITSAGGAESIRTKVLKAVLDGEREAIARGESARSVLAPTNYLFQPNGIDTDGLANVRLSPLRKERALLSGMMFLKPEEGQLVRVQGRLAKNPSFWVKDVDIVRTYERINAAVVPVTMESKAHVRFLGAATFQMTYKYLEIDGRTVELSTERVLRPD